MNISTQKAILELLNKAGIKQVMVAMAEDKKQVLEEAKQSFLASLTPKKREAYKMTFLSILQEGELLAQHENKDIRENWGAFFIGIHDEKIVMLQEDYNKASNAIISDYGFDYVSRAFLTDKRDLIEIMEATSQVFAEAVVARNKRQEELEVKLHAQLREVANTLHLMTNDNDADVKQFGIETESGRFDIELFNKEDECNCNSSEKEQFEKILNSLFGIK